MESSSEKVDKSDESGEPNDSIEKVETKTSENIVPPECHPMEEIKDDTTIDANSSKIQMSEDVDLSDIVLITESLPPVMPIANSQSIEPNITNQKEEGELELQAANQNEGANQTENVNIAQENDMLPPEKCDDEPMDIDEILNSLDVDFDTPSSSEVQNACEVSSAMVAGNPPELSSTESESKGEEVVLLSDDEDAVENENALKMEEIKDDPEIPASNADQEPVKSDDLFDALLSSAVVPDTAVEAPVVANIPQPTEAEDTVMLSDDERNEKAAETEVQNETTDTAAKASTPKPQQSQDEIAGPSEIPGVEAAEHETPNVENQANVENALNVDEPTEKPESHNEQPEVPVGDLDDLLMENDELFAEGDKINESEDKVSDITQKSPLHVSSPPESGKAAEVFDVQSVENPECVGPMIEDKTVEGAAIKSPIPQEQLVNEEEPPKADEIAEDPPMQVDAVMESAPAEDAAETLVTPESNQVEIKDTENAANPTHIENQVEPIESTESDTYSDAKSTIEVDNVDGDNDVQAADDTGDKPEPTQKSDDIQESVSDAMAPLDVEKSLSESKEQTVDEAERINSPIQMDVDEPPAPLKEKTVPSVRKECINLECPKESDTFYFAPEFIINHFHLTKRPKNAYVCESCHDSVTEHYGELCAALEDKQPLFTKMTKQINMIEVIDSSDEEDDDKSQCDGNDDDSFDADTLAMIENELESVITETLRRVDIEQQMDWNYQLMKHKIETNEKNCFDMMREVKSLQNEIDTLYTNTYKIRHSFAEEIQSFDCKTMKPTQICNESYPPAGELKYPDIAYNTLYYTFRKQPLSRWQPCKVIDKMTNAESGTCEYSVSFCHETKVLPSKHGVLRKHLAYGRAPEYRLNIGTRVIALFIDIDSSSVPKQKNKVVRNNFYPGVIGEPLSLYTNWRYLVFFDDGYTQYVYHENIRVVCEPVENVWDLIEEPGGKLFVEGYIKQLKKKRPIIQAKRGQRIQTEFGGKWYNSLVNAVDGSLVQMYCEDLKRYEWIYRGSTRFLPLYQKVQQHAVQAKTPIETIIEYITIDDDKEPERSTEPPPEETPPTVATPPPSADATAAATASSQPTESPKTAPIQRTFASQAVRDTPQQKQREQKRAVAKKSTAPQPKPTIQHMNNSTIYVDEDNPKGKVVYYTAKKHLEVKKYIHHECQPSCLIQVKHNLATYSPLSKPLLSGFERQICKTRFNKKFVLYRAPCGRRLRDMDEMHRYLRMTRCVLNVDNFTFDPLVHCLAEYVIEQYVVKKPDLSDGVEKMPVQMINQYDTTQPPPCVYSAKRIPTEGVALVLDDEFLCGCDCTDDCIDKTKCACWQLTLQGAKYGNPEMPIEEVGYEYKRLNDPVPTGIYECNNRCKCKSNCLNRVVQHPLNLKLQVFKTVNRGWGLRCLNDVPKGSFICCYAGNLLTETAANDAGEDLGDEYFAELDYIEVVENMKEGYEPDVVEENESSSSDDDFDVEEEKECSRNDDSDDEFVAAKRYMSSEDSESRRYRTRNSVDTRKKPDQAAAKPKEGAERRRERGSSSDDDGDGVRQVKNFMVSDSMPLTNEPTEEKRKSIRKMYGKNEAVYIMDAKKAGNIGRYFNHSCGPNLFVQNVFVDTHDLRFPWVAFFASTHIRAGTELTWNYNYEVGSVPNKVLICQCGDIKCRGRIL